MTADKDYAAIIAGIGAYTAELRRAVPPVMQGFGTLARAATAGGAVDAKTKELIALAIGVTQRCDGCIGFHGKALVELGATRSEVAEVLGLCVYMGGGPALMYAADALRAYDQFAGPQPA
ncbi:carboxymuconolactone decarboxylase family protein [Paracoccus shanxieyensis]|uniref:Carboxymuconolactone decarboxylase family protein n=1 Tax=Paracoccus shanxieyensis TaxID=2675752 RepID=A0A6L6J0S1_9RHOB|nr:carboxymuconolactone decarboxylase family protein [Paracoccus shanxieyensis]MTH64404.1 carboxymuconolactone decarboxylase family protein [Paracoccus shanxieyensis]MTH87603.1 carboxymuconolactone decarboxylase family protein [Paracoccus shanxieyensis]